MSSPNAEELLQIMKNDFVHGSSWYYEKAIEYVEKYAGDVKVALTNLADLRPGMASITNVIEVLSNALKTNKLNETLYKLKEFGKIAKERISENTIEASAVITLSNSSAVRAILEKSKVKKIYLMESFPGEESQTAKSELSKFADVSIIPDSSIYQFVEFSDYAVIGFDGLYAGGYLMNKVGSLPLACISNYLKLPVVAVGESYKATEGFPPPSLKVDYKGVKIGLFERVPLSLISELITDAGTREKPQRNDVLDIQDYFINSILNNWHS